jgi:peptidoglycan/LPS O-acetylase OafA/YrhL
VSLSIEVLLYAMFFVLARTRLMHPLMLAVIALGGAFITREYNWIGRGVLSFFTGGLCFYLTRDWCKSHRLDPVLTACALLVPAGALLIQIVREDVSFAERFTVIVLFPALILTLATNEIRLKPIIGPLRCLGNISYSSYLIHFPLALSFVTAASYFGFVIDPSSPWSLLSFLAFLIVLSILSFSFFETPVQGFLRTIAVAHFNARSQKTKTANRQAP